jgi:hypothetical protein
MDIVPETTCSCGQKIPIDRDCCPYCGAVIKSYWYDDLGDVKRATLFSENAKAYLFIDGKKLSLDNWSDIPRPLRQCLRVSQQPNTFVDRIIQQVQRFFDNVSSNDPPLPAQWDKWLEK